MATYSRVTPASLTNFSAVIDDPQDSEDANKVGQVDLQTRRFIYDFLSSRFDKDSSDVLKADSVADATLAGKVKGSTSNSGTQQAIVQGTISTPDLRDGAVTAAKLATGAISTTGLADGAVTTVKLADAPNGVATAKLQDTAVTTAKLADKAVTDAKLASDAATDASRAVGTDHIKNLAVTSGKIATGAVGADQLFTGTDAQILVADSGGKFRRVTLSGAATISNTGVLSLVTLAFAFVRERVGNTVVGGAAAATTWNTRGVDAAWVKEWETVTSMVTIGSSGKISLAAGTYIIETEAPGYKVDEHISRISRYNSADVLQESIYGTSEISTAAAVVQTRTKAIAKMTFAASDYFKVEHYTKTANAVDGLGHPSSSGGTYEAYSTVKIQRLS